MIRSRLLVAFAALVPALPLGAQPDPAIEAAKASIRERYVAVERSLTEWTATEKVWTHPAGEGLLTSWSDAEGRLRKLELVHDTDGASVRLAYWFDDAAPFFGLESEEHVPTYGDEAAPRDLREDRFYLVDGRLVEWLRDRPGEDRSAADAAERHAREDLLMRAVRVLRAFADSSETDLWDFDVDGVVFQRDVGVPALPVPSRR